MCSRFLLFWGQIESEAKLWTIFSCEIWVDKLKLGSVRACKSCPKWALAIRFSTVRRAIFQQEVGRVPAGHGEIATVLWRTVGDAEIESVVAMEPRALCS